MERLGKVTNGPFYPKHSMGLVYIYIYMPTLTPNQPDNHPNVW